MSELYKLIYKIVKSIPVGKVSTYGQIAFISGNSRRSRVVGYAMAACKDSSVPCHRVIRSTGELARTFGFMGPNHQRDLLLNEGVEVSIENTVNLEVYLWDLDEALNNILI